MNVLALVHQYIPERSAGAETHLHAMLRALAHRGHRVDVSLSKQTGEPYAIDGVHVWPAVDQRRDAFWLLADADVVVTHLENTTRASVLGQWNNKPVVVLQHNTFEESKRALIVDTARVDMVAVNSEWMAADLRQWFIAVGQAQPETVIVRPTVDVAEYATTAGGCVTLVNLRRKVPTSEPLTKGGELFRALAERMPDVPFLGVTGSYGVQQELADLPNVEVLDHVPHDQMRDRVYARTRVLLVPSSYESWGRVGTEALCSGIPVIANPTPGLTESLDRAGIFVDRDDVDGWEGAIRTLLDNRHAWAAASKVARARAEQLAQLDDLDRWCDAIETTANQTTRTPAAV